MREAPALNTLTEDLAVRDATNKRQDVIAVTTKAEKVLPQLHIPTNIDHGDGFITTQWKELHVLTPDPTHPMETVNATKDISHTQLDGKPIQNHLYLLEIPSRNVTASFILTYDNNGRWIRGKANVSKTIGRVDIQINNGEDVAYMRDVLYRIQQGFYSAENKEKKQQKPSKID